MTEAGQRAGHEHFVILSNIDLGSKMDAGRVMREKSAPCCSWEMMCAMTGLAQSASLSYN